jgi:hypothetical protein
MKVMSFAAAAMLLAACRTATPVASPAAPVAEQSKAVPAESLVDHEGDSPQTAVAIPKGEPNDGIDFENNWIYDHFGRFRRDSYGIGNLANRKYEMIKIELPDGSFRTVYFDITDLWENREKK